MRITGIIYSLDLNHKVISLKEYKSLTYFHLSSRHIKKFKNYLYKGNLVSFECSDLKNTLNSKYKAISVDYFYEISVPSTFGKEVLYSKRETTKELRSFLNNLDYTLFLDIEMSMPEYGERIFIGEMIEVGYILVDRFDHIVKQESFYIKLSLNKTLSRRTEEFLGITTKMLNEKGVNYLDFYNIYKDILNTYNPSVIIFGKNDKKFLESSFNINHCPSLNNKTRFINISQLLKTFYELSSDPGLFRMYETLYDTPHIPQRHDALEDAIYTYYVFKAFKKEVNKLK